MNTYPQTETEVREKYNINVPCCQSCHEDDDNDLGQMCVIYWEDDSEVEICCAVKNAYEDLNK